MTTGPRFRCNEVVGTFPQDDLPPRIVMAVQVSAAEREWMRELRRQSYELAVERGHINRLPS